MTMKKDGIQTRNRKMSTKSKKKCKSGAMDLLKPTLERPFGTFSPPSLQHPMHNPMPTYMAGAGGFGSSFMSSQGHQQGGFGGSGLGGVLGGGFPSSSLGAGGLGAMGGSSSLYTSSGLNLSTNSPAHHHSMVGAMA